MPPENTKKTKDKFTVKYISSKVHNENMPFINFCIVFDFLFFYLLKMLRDQHKDRYWVKEL